MNLHNTLTKKSETFKSLRPGKVGIYSCGPTVYDHIHIGNLSSFTFADTLRRVIAASDYVVEHVMNFTDIDDKTIKRSIEKYPNLDAREALGKLTETYSNIFLEDMRLIGNDVDAVTFIKATSFIEEIQQLIKELVASGYAYITDDGVYFSIKNYRDSGKKYGQLLEITDNNISEARIDNDEYDKDSAHDFALWKKQKDSEPAWEFELNSKDLKGRPGWHIECSVMSKQSLGQPFDIHTGGIDLIFPHHENEIAQSTAGQESAVFSSVFMHNEHLLIDGRKMSKSLHNFYSLKDITEKGFEPLAVRVLFLQAHYRKQMNFTWDGLQAAANRLRNLRSFADLRFQPLEDGIQSELIYLTKERIENALHNDFATPEALASLSDLASTTEVKGVNENALEDFTAFIKWLDDVLGLRLADSKDLSKAQKELIIKRSSARQEKNWTESDNIRLVLEKDGIGIRDAPHGQVWHRL